MIACRGHKAHITALAFNGDLIVSGSNDGTIIFWTPENEEEYKKHIFEVHTSPVTKIEIDIDERRVVTLSDDCAIGIWNIQNLPNEIAHERTLTTDMNRQHLSLHLRLNTIILTGHRNGDATLEVMKIDEGNVLVSLLMSTRVATQGDRQISCESEAADKNEVIYVGHNNGAVSQWRIKSIQCSRETMVAEGQPITILRLNKRINKLLVATQANMYIYEAETMALLCQLDSGATTGNIYTTLIQGGMQIMHLEHASHEVKYYNYVQSSQGNSLTHSLLPGQNLRIDQTRINSVDGNISNAILGCANNSIHVYDCKTGQMAYVLLGGSVNPRNRPASFVENPNLQGCCMAFLDEVKIIGVFGNLIRIYSFDN